jgi:hypothetical protein
MDKQTVGGETPASAPAEKTDIPVTAPAADTSSLQPKQNFTDKVKDASSPQAVRQLIEEAKRNGLRAPKPGEEQKPAEGNPAADIPPDLKAAAAAEETPAAEAEAAPDETPAEEPTPTPEGDDADDADGADEAVTPSQAKKLRLRLPEDDKVGRLAAAYLQRNRDLGMEAALEKARAQLGIKPQTDAKTAETAPKAEGPQTVEEVEATIKQLRADRKKANTELRFEDASDLSDKLEDMQYLRSALERKVESQKAEASRTYEQTFRASEAKANELYAFAADPESPGGKRMKEIDDALEETEDPRFHAPNKPLLIAQMVAAEMNIAPRKKGTPAAPAKPAAPVAPVPAAKKGVLPGGASRTVPAPTNQKPAIVATIEAAKTIHDIRNIRKQLGLQT